MMKLTAKVEYNVKFIKSRIPYGVATGDNYKMADFSANIIVDFNGKKIPQYYSILADNSDRFDKFNSFRERINFLNKVEAMINDKGHEKRVKKFLKILARDLFSKAKGEDEYKDLLNNIQEKLTSENTTFVIEEKDGEITCKSL